MSDAEGKRMCPGSNCDHKVGYIPELVENILFKLPLKHLLKCKTVFKMWKELIDEHHFAKLCFSNSRKNPQLIVYIYKEFHEPGTRLYLIEENGRNFPFVRFPGFVHDVSSFEVICSFNGLICCTEVVEKELIIRICNPFTQECHVLPSGSPSVTTPSVGVVYDSENHKYKVLRFFRENLESEDNCYKCETYSPGTKAWTRVDDVPCPVSNYVYPPSHVNVGGRIYWLNEGNGFPSCILSIDMDGHFTTVNLPESIRTDYPTYVILVEFENKLLLISVDDKEDYFLMWLLQNHHDSSWFDLGPITHGMEGFQTLGSIVAVKNELLFVFMPRNAQNFRYSMLNMKKMTWRKLRVSRKLRKDFPVVLPFIESLFKCGETS